MIILGLVMLSAFGSWDQQPSKPLPPAPALPANWFGCGMNYTGTASPHYAGWCAYAKLISANQQVYSFTTYGITVPRVPAGMKRKLVTSTRTGFMPIARVIKMDWGTLYLAPFATAGVAIGPATNFSWSSGGGGFLQPKGSNWTYEAIIRVDAVGNVMTKVFEIGMGYSFK